MSAPEATGTRQRTNKVETPTNENQNPANPNKKVPRNKPHVKPPFVDMSMNKFLTYLVLSLFLLFAFYMWRFTVWAHQAGGYWALITGHHMSPAEVAAKQAASSASASSSVASSTASATTSGHPQKIKAKPTQDAGDGDDNIQSQIFNLASALGITPAELSSAIRPLVDPSVPNPAEKAKQDAQLLQAKMASQQHENENQEGSVLDMLGEALLD
ncbi:hypothetical protein CNBA1810 [Cryptococcus deneoformans B-3501A]|uniref:hypothetical protein n=1 Tax=Cryptococcus deneoformans (strain B-3501A) TaxID=283643 RepID=UPI000042E698|nr:hypothetical protein CNBA1810 [Cryptococcus neoformans var. neoformans B-3501A]EAL23534.1 hypothetical protein CNBA1810 [Cryptococcus neoformans var. neoformans B-3501A]